MFFNANEIRARANENKPEFYPDAKIVQLGNGLFQILSNNKVIYEGEMKDGKKHGEGAEYFDYEKGLVKYVGHYENGKRNGEGQRYVLRNGEPVLVEEGIFKDWYFKKGKKYLEGQLEYDGEVETIGNLVKMDQEKKNKTTNDNQKNNDEHYNSDDDDDFDDDEDLEDDEEFDDDEEKAYRDKTKLEYLYHGKGSKYTPGESHPTFIGEFDRGVPTVGKVFYDSSAFTKDKLRQLPSYRHNNKPVNEKEQDIKNTENKYRNNHIQMGEKKMQITEDNNGNKKVEYFVEVNKKFGDTKSKYKLYKEKKGIFKDKIKYNDDCNNLSTQQYLLSRHIQGTWGVPKQKGGNIIFEQNANGKTTKYNLTTALARDIAKYIK